MGLLTFALSVTLSKCCDHREMVVDDEMLRYWTRMMDAARAMLFGCRKPPWMQRRWWNAQTAIWLSSSSPPSWDR